MGRYRITSFGTDIIISKKLINLTTLEYANTYMPIDYFPTQEDFMEYVNLLNEHISRVPKCFREAFDD